MDRKSIWYVLYRLVLTWVCLKTQWWDCDVDTRHLKWWSSGQRALLSGCFYLGTPVLCHFLNVCSHLTISFHTFDHFLDNLKISLIWRSTIVCNYSLHLIFKTVSVPFGLFHNGWREWPAYWGLVYSPDELQVWFLLKTWKKSVLIPFLYCFSWG